MRYPFWILNSSLLALLLMAILFIVFTQQTFPTKQAGALKAKKSALTVPAKPLTYDGPLSAIYENDLFGTYYEKTTPTEPNYQEAALPQAPTPTAAVIPAEPVMPFLPPLKVTLKGIMVLSDESNNQAIIADNQTQKEENYKVGDAVEDAQIIRILGNKVILVRSNGQMETLYLNEKDIVSDPQFAKTNRDWDTIIKNTKTNYYVIDPHSFVQVVPTIAHCIDMLDLTTVYHKGQSVGCRVGQAAHESLGQALGFEAQDIITSIIDIPTTSTQDRLTIYEKLVQQPFGQPFIVTVERNGQTMNLTYEFGSFLSEEGHELEKEYPGILQGPTPEEIEQEKIKVLKEKYRFAKTTQDLLIEQQKKMIEEGSKERLTDFSLSAES